MLFIFYFNLLFVVILFVIPPKENKANRWLITFCMSAAIGALSESLVSDIIPGIRKIGYVYICDFMFELHIYFLFLSEVISPYAILMYTIVYSAMVKVETEKKLSYILAIPMAAMVFFTNFHPDIVINFRVLLVWAAPYFLIASWTMFNTWRSEINMYRKRNKFRIFIVLVPAWLGFFIFNYFFRSINPHTELFHFVSVFFFLAYTLFIGYIYLNGTFGIKVRIEQQALEKSIRIMSEGTAILNHTIKNEISKIKFSFNIAQISIKKKDLDEAKKSIESVFYAIESIDNMVDRIRSKTEEIILKETSVELMNWVKNCVDEAKAIANSKGIQITTELKHTGTLYGDKPLLTEVLNNILNNAMEAIIVPKGLIHVQMFEMKKGGISIEVSDNGVGIPKQQLNRIMEPFFSTKKNIKNHGLGLSFCYNVIRLHDGEIFVHSEVGKGTSVVIQFPKSRIIPTKLNT